MVTLDAVLLGGGIGSRFSGQIRSHSGQSPMSHDGQASVPKQFQLLGGVPVFVHCLKSFLAMDCFRQIVIAMPKEFIGQAEEFIDAYVPRQSKTILRVVPGGDRRQDSSCLALEAVEELSPLPTRVLIHDACRPYLSPEFLKRVGDCLLDRAYGAWVPVVPVIETLKRVENSQVVETVERGRVQRVQTPQIFEFTVIRSLAEKAKNFPELSFTDDASLCEYYGIPVGAFEGDVRNIKLTYDFELETLRSMLTEAPKETPCAPESVTTFTA